MPFSFADIVAVSALKRSEERTTIQKTLQVVYKRDVNTPWGIKQFSCVILEGGEWEMASETSMVCPTTPAGYLAAFVFMKTGSIQLALQMEYYQDVLSSIKNITYVVNQLEDDLRDYAKSLELKSKQGALGNEGNLLMSSWEYIKQAKNIEFVQNSTEAEITPFLPKILWNLYLFDEPLPKISRTLYPSHPDYVVQVIRTLSEYNPVQLSEIIHSCLVVWKPTLSPGDYEQYQKYFPPPSSAGTGLEEGDREAILNFLKWTQVYAETMEKVQADHKKARTIVATAQKSMNNPSARDVVKVAKEIQNKLATQE